jgi:glucose-6-phosphate dehydrogenase assembly protein OpcA
VSALAAQAAARTEWHGQDVELDEVADRLLRMNRDHARHAHGHAATRTLTLLVAPGPDTPAEALAERLEQMRTRHPARTILLCEHAPDRLDASVRIECAVGSAAGATGYCHDAVVLRASRARLAHADSLVHALLVAGLPTVLWLPGAQASAAQQPLAQLADAIVLDTGDARTLPDALARAAQLDAIAPVRDLAWLALVRWRQRVAARFDEAAARALLARTERLELRCGDGAALAGALLLAGWIAARAGWRIATLAPGGDDAAWQGTARRDDGGAVALAIGVRGAAPPGAEAHAIATPDGIDALVLRAGAEALELLEPVAEPDGARTFAAALRTFDEAAAGYAPALGALRDGLAAR